jgi:hypothetical protein
MPLFDKVVASEVRYIKLGLGGRWQERALTEDRIYWSIATDPVHEATRGDWGAAAAKYRVEYSAQASATGALRELRDFFTLGTDALWITFARGRMWWAFSEPAELVQGEVGPGDPAACRRTIGPWRSTDRYGQQLDQAALSTKLTQMAAYRRSICAVAEADYAVRRINGEQEANVALLHSHRQALIEAAASLIRDLHWRDFELLVDLIFTSAGWRRVSEVGGAMKDIDLLLEQPVTGERISVQVKSKVDQTVVSSCVRAFEEGVEANRFFIVYHTGRAALNGPEGPRPVHLWDCLAIAERAVDAGLTDWLAARAG